MYVPSGILQLHRTIAEDIINSHGILTTLYYVVQTQCSNCPTGTTWITGGKVPLQSICPYCNGTRIIFSENTSQIRQLVYYEPKTWVKINTVSNLQNPSMAVQTRTLYSNLAAIKSADYCIIEGRKYTLAGEPTPHGMINRPELLCMWEPK